jgi:hypothetical protein
LFSLTSPELDVDVSEVGVDVSDFEVDVSEVGVDVSDFEVDVSEVGVDVSDFEVDVSEVGVDLPPVLVSADALLMPEEVVVVGTLPFEICLL